MLHAVNGFFSTFVPSFRSLCGVSGLLAGDSGRSEVVFMGVVPLSVAGDCPREGWFLRKKKE